MLKLVKQSARHILRRCGYDIIRLNEKQQLGFPLDFDEPTIKLCEYVEPYTMTSRERVFALRRSVEYIVDQDIPGDVVECGVWKGGSMMAVARTLMERGANARKLYLFDTYEGMTEPTEADVNYRGMAALSRWRVGEKWDYSPLDEVKSNMRDTGYDEEKVLFVKGKVEDTLPKNAPERISLLRLDTDWYESTYHELVHLYPRLSVGGVLIIDDYGFWAGQRKAVDRYIDEHDLALLLTRVDNTARVCVKLKV